MWFPNNILYYELFITLIFTNLNTEPKVLQLSKFCFYSTT